CPATMLSNAMHKTLIALVATFYTSTAYADTLISNVNGIQATADGKVQHFKALVVGDDGKVRQLLEHPDAVRLANITSTVDGGGRTLLPGLIDGHGHVIDLGFAALRLDVTGTASLAEFQQRLRDYAAAYPDAKWIQGFGWNQEL